MSCCVCEYAGAAVAGATVVVSYSVLRYKLQHVLTRVIEQRRSIFPALILHCIVVHCFRLYLALSLAFLFVCVGVCVYLFVIVGIMFGKMLMMWMIIQV